MWRPLCPERAVQPVGQHCPRQRFLSPFGGIPFEFWMERNQSFSLIIIAIAEGDGCHGSVNGNYFHPGGTNPILNGEWQ
jgi:hypothetical protein